MKKILLVSGHTSGYNYSDITKVNEGDLNIELVKMIHALLSKYAEVTVYPIDRDMYKDNKNGSCKVNMAEFDYIFEVHFNAYNGKAYGTNIQIHSDYKGGTTVEQAVIDNIAAFGFRKRGNNGISRRNDLLNMNKALKLGVDYALLETCFYDNVADMNIYNKNKAAIAKAIVDGIVSAFGLGEVEKPAPAPTPDPSKPSEPASFKVRISIDNLNIRKGPGTNYAKTGKYTGAGTFTIVDTKPGIGSDSGWGKLKSGAGWIALDFAKRI